MSLDVLAALAEDSPVAHLLPLVESWPGLAMLARNDGSCIAASASWASQVGISPTELRLHGWRHFVVEDDGHSTDAEVAAMSGPDGRAAVGFRNKYRAADGRVTTLEWHATPFLGTLGVTLATVQVIHGHQHPRESAFGAEQIEALIAARKVEQWRRHFSHEGDRAFRWVAKLDGEIVFSEGGGYPPGAFVGKKMGKDFGENPEFFVAVEKLQASGVQPATLIQFASAKEDNNGFRGRRFAHSYSMVLTPSGRPFGVAVTSLDVTGAILEAGGKCHVFDRQCPLHKLKDD